MDLSEVKAPEASGEKKLYWAAKEGADLAKEVMERVDDFYERAKNNKIFEKFDKSYRAFYGLPFNGSEGNAVELTASGEQAEFQKISVNHYANILRHQTNLTTTEKPAMKPVATNTDAESMSQAYQAQGILEAYQRKLNIDKHLSDTVHKALMGGEAHLRLEWDSSGGPDYMGMPAGDIKASTLTVLDVIKDSRKNSPGDIKSHIVRTWWNKYDLAALYPEFEKDILDSGNTPEYRSNKELRCLTVGPAEERDEDEIAVFELIHDKTPALPKGRYAIVLNDKTILQATDFMYPEVTLYRLSPEDLVGTGYGHSPMFDLLALQEMVNHLYGIIYTNQKAFGHQNVLCPSDADVNVEALSGGLNLIKYRPNAHNAKPEPLNLTNTPREIFEFIKMAETVMETLSGVNSTVRGNAPKNLESGSALALVQSQALAFMNQLQRAYAALVEKVGTGMLRLLKQFASVPQKVSLAGKSQQFRVMDFTSKDLEFVDSVMVEQVNALSQTTAGKMDVSEKLLAAQLVSPEQFITLRNTGKFERIDESDMKQRLLAQKENEWLRDGQPVPPPVLFEDHRIHIMALQELAADPEFKQGPNMPALVEHATAHFMCLATPDPVSRNILLMLKQHPIMPPPMPMPPEGPGGPGGANDQGSQPMPPGPENSSATPPEAGMPSMPNNPATGQTWNPVDGGGARPPV